MRTYFEAMRGRLARESVTRDTQLVSTVLEGGERIFCHPETACGGQCCCIHRRSDHHMRGWAQHFRSDRQIMERVCPHGVGHPDPDDLVLDTSHGCDGCCAMDGVDHMAELKETLLRMRATARTAAKMQQTPRDHLGVAGGNVDGSNT